MFYVLFALAILSRFLPHPPNVAAVGALGLFAGCYLTQRRSWMLPVAAMFASDVIGQVFAIPGMGFYHPISMVAVYIGFALAALVGRQLQNRVKVHTVFAGAIVSSLLFFLVSNLGVYLSGNWTGTATTLLNCYLAAIPFLGASLIGDLIYVALMFGIYEAVRHYGTDWTMRRRQPVPVRR